MPPHHSHASPSTRPRGSADAKREASECEPYMNGWSSAAMRRRRAARLAWDTAGWSGGAGRGWGRWCLRERVSTDGGGGGSKSARRTAARPGGESCSEVAERVPRTRARDPPRPLHPTAPLCPAHANAGPRRAPCPRDGRGALQLPPGALCPLQWCPLVVDPCGRRPPRRRPHAAHFTTQSDAASPAAAAGALATLATPLTTCSRLRHDVVGRGGRARGRGGGGGADRPRHRHS